uniref:General secretion pathway protein H n=1 Tax=Polynucleobacter necessarius subsp. necessarius (strain STIR1) TaxID=452638 RepID=B1XUC4_POLNS
MNQHGVTFLEVIIVITILMVIVSSLVSPSITDWRQKRALESDFHAVSAQVDYLKTRARAINGTAVLICASATGTGKKLSYQISSKAQSDLIGLSTGFASNVVEDPAAKDPSFNLLSGQTQIVSSLCNGLRGIFLSSGQSGLEGGSAPIDIAIEPSAGKAQFGAYRILLNQHTGFLQKFKWSNPNSQWVEIE